VSRKKDRGINPELEKHINQLLQAVMSDQTASITEKMKVVDRALKLEALKQKADMDEWGSGFASGDDEE
jgi:predicted transcriptional regulator